MTKPIDTEEMLLRIRALLRRSQIVNERKLTIGKVRLDYDALTVTRENEIQTLPQKEFYLLYKLLSYPGRIFTRIQLMDEIWGMESMADERTVDVHIKRIASTERLNLVTAKNDYKIIDEFQKLAQEIGISQVKMDYLLWNYCSKGYGEVCTATPKCDECVIKSIVHFHY